MAIYAGAIDEEPYLPQAKELLRRFRAVEGRNPADYLEIEDWSRNHLDQKGGKFLVF
jgi:hypothetical protein